MSEEIVEKSKILSFFESTAESIKNFITKAKGIKKTVYADNIIRNDRGEILLLHRGYADGLFSGAWGFPGGHVDEGENPTQAAQRETLEETGLAAIANFLHTKEKKDCIIHYFYGEVIDEGPLDSLIMLDNEEHRGWAWVPVEKLKEYRLVADLSTYIDSLITLLPPQLIPIQEYSNEEELIANSPIDQHLIEIETYWEVLQKAFDNHIIDEEQFLKGRELYHSALEKGGKKAFIGEKRIFAGKEYEKTIDGWKYCGDPKKAPVKTTDGKKAPAAEEWWGSFKQYKLNCYPFGIDKKHVDVNEEGDVHSHWILRWKDPKSGTWKNAYSKEFMDRNAKEKWNRIQNVDAKAISTIKERSKHTFLTANDEKTREAAAIINIIAHTGLRRGDKLKFDKSGNRGVSSLSPDNIKIEGSTIKFNFIGKSYQENTAEIVDGDLARFLSHCQHNKKGQNYLFDTTDALIDSTFDACGGEGLKIKDMRTYVATDLARQLLFEDPQSPPPVPEGLSKTAITKLIKEKLNGVYEKVSQKLNNTPAMAKNSYIHPNILDCWMKGLGLDFEIAKSENVDSVIGSPSPTLDEIIAMYPRYVIQETDTIDEEDEEMCDMFNEPEFTDTVIDSLETALEILQKAFDLEMIAEERYMEALEKGGVGSGLYDHKKKVSSIIKEHIEKYVNENEHTSLNVLMTGEIPKQIQPIYKTVKRAIKLPSSVIKQLLQGKIKEFKNPNNQKGLSTSATDKGITQFVIGSDERFVNAVVINLPCNQETSIDVNKAVKYFNANISNTQYANYAQEDEVIIRNKWKTFTADMIDGVCVNGEWSYFKKPK